MIKNKDNKPLFIVSAFLILVIFLLTFFNYFFTGIKWSESKLVGLNFTRQEKDVDYFGEKYVCDENFILYINIEGSLNSVRDRNVSITRIDNFGTAEVRNMKLKEVTENEVVYVYKENVLVIDKNDLATFLINDIAISKNCKKEVK